MELRDSYASLNVLNAAKAWRRAQRRGDATRAQTHLHRLELAVDAYERAEERRRAEMLQSRTAPAASAQKAAVPVQRGAVPMRRRHLYLVK